MIVEAGKKGQLSHNKGITLESLKCEQNKIHLIFYITHTNIFIQLCVSVRKKNLRLQSSFSIGFTENTNAKQRISITSEVVGGHANTRRDYFEPYLKFYLQKIYLIKMITIYRHTPLTKTCLPTIFVAFKRIITIVRQTGNTQTNCTMSTMNDIFSTPDKPDLSLSTECDVCNICQ